MSRTSCQHCQNPRSFTPEEFKARFKVGDIVTSWSTNKPVKITAIGVQRFLALEIDRKNRETVCTQKRIWRKIGVVGK